ncbi:hypothetical protein [Providencia sneebia]|uniref:Uncharacterized protein n=1 Tax=Providencia sneebia DSM 19967 TaxID=1141660 RepID=K8WH71_9GAMM|nr:hypothetical protein [Providencia sneebia]EKT55620.1 hypothetical protein OO7_11589 [Providencia sneebia DSM 19967]
MNEQYIQNPYSRYAYCVFENYWGEALHSVEITHYVKGFIDKTKRLQTYKLLEDVPDKTVAEQHFQIVYEQRIIDSYDYWNVVIKTESGKIYRTKDNFYCSIAYYDDNQIILGVNGDAKSLYVVFTHSSGYNTELIEVSS